MEYILIILASSYALYSVPSVTVFKDKQTCEQVLQYIKKKESFVFNVHSAECIEAEK